MSARASICLLVGAVALVLSPMAFYGPHDQEEWVGSVWSTLQYASAIWSGRIPPPMWSDTMGLGTPMPLGNRLDLAPPFLLFPIVPIQVIVPVFYAFYLAVAVAFVWRLAVDVGLRGVVRVMVVLTFLLSAPTVQLIYSDDWPTVFHNWCLFPVIVFYIRRLFLSSEPLETRRLVLCLGLVGGLWALNGHSGHMAVLASILVVYAGALLWHRPGVLRPLVLSVLVASLISAEHIYYLVSETLRFPAEITRFQAQDGISLTTLAHTLIRPLDTLLVPLVTGGAALPTPDRLRAVWWSYLDDFSLRIPFMGTVFLVAAMVWSLRSIRKRDRGPAGSALAEQRAVTIVIVFSSAMIFTKASWLLNIPSGTWFYREGIVLFGLLAAGQWCQAQADGRTPVKPWLPALLAVQIVQMVAGSFPAFHHIISTEGMHFYQSLGRPERLPGWILSHARQPGSRLFATSAFSLEADFVEDGLYGVTDLTFLGLRPFNATFKSVSMDDVAQSQALGHGWIPGHYDLITLNRPMLDVFGVDLVLALDNEPSDRLTLLAERKSVYKNAPRVVKLYRNDSAWRHEFLMELAVATLAEERAPNCRYRGAVCRDFREWKRYLLNEDVSVEGQDGAYRIRLRPSERERLLVMSKLYRPEWAASSRGRTLSVERVGGALVSVRIPSGVSDVTLEFRPVVRRALLAVSAASFIVVAACAVWLLIKGPTRRFVHAPPGRNTPTV